MGRQVRRVPVDFDWPLDKVWLGFLRPDELRERDCPTCSGDGLTVEARAIENTFYAHQINWTDREHGQALAWHDKIGQAEVDNLLKEGRLHTLVRREPTDDNPRDWEWKPLPLLAVDVNAVNRSGGMLHPYAHDAINRMILVRYRCEVLGIPMICAACDGHGSVEKYEGQRADSEAWVPTEPPAGDGWQLWETVSEGSPISPVFSDREGLVEWLMSPAYCWGTSRPLTREQAEAFAQAGWSPTLIGTRAAGIVPGEQHVGGAQ